MKLHHQIENIDHSEKPWLILVNGLFASLQSWDGALPPLINHFRVLRYDCRGQGQSPRPSGAYTLDQHVNDLLELINNLKIERCFLLGISNGGRIAMKFSKLYPQKVFAQVLADTYDNVSELMKLKLTSWKVANQLGGPTHRFSVAAPWIWGEQYLSDNPQLFKLYRDQAHVEKPEVIESLIDGALTGEIHLNNEPTPTLMVAGDEDLLTPIRTHQEMIKNFQEGHFKVVKGGHASLLEYPQSVKETILPFMKEYL